MFVFHLTDAEAAEMRGPVAGSGGQQSFHRSILADLERSHTIPFDDKRLGKLIRYMTMYGHSGGFQGRLRRAFIRSIALQLGFL